MFSSELKIDFREVFFLFIFLYEWLEFAYLMGISVQLVRNVSLYVMCVMSVSCVCVLHNGQLVNQHLVLSQ